jgi:hypothetical protein
VSAQSFESLARAEESSTAASELKPPSSTCNNLRSGRDTTLKLYTALQVMRSADMTSFLALHKQLAMLPVRIPSCREDSSVAKNQ